MSRVIFPVLFLAAAAGFPYLSSEWTKSDSTPAEVAHDGSRTPIPAGVPASGATAAIAPSISAPPKPQLAEPPIVNIAEAIRFDVSSSWIINRWPRVTAGLPEGGLQGYRVPLITGTRHDDIAGSLTYYFNAQQTCQKIVFQGTTGDPRKVTSHVAGQFRLTRQNSSDPGLLLYQSRWNGKAVSELKIKAKAVVKADAPHARYDVELTLSNWSQSPAFSLFGR